eukprot:TRINITY_DN1838_c0_g1_i1.p1 TRINITY_DN1838_c0_g1~~TRINITY_DN1838_c0_g1_i1.p1  ORF type:complete len:426 (-),score=82.04 TRINITY_DN1838_c0_g1_i1:50-1300(-)
MRDETYAVEEAPQDHWSIAWWCAVFLGIAQLFPWNTFITANDYFGSVFPTSFLDFVFQMPIAYNVSNLATLFLLNFYGNRVSVRTKLLTGFFLGFAMLILVPVINYFDLPELLRYIVCMFATFVSGFTTAVLMGTGFGLVASLPPSYTTALMIGQGIGGVIIGAFQLLLDSAIFPKATTLQLQWEGIIMFCTASVVMLLCTFLTMKLQTMPFFLYHQHKRSDPSMQMERPESDEMMGLLDADPELSLGQLIGKIWPDALSVFLVFFISLTIFPGFSILFQNYAPEVPFPVILTFQVFDFVGRSLPKFVVIIPRKFLLLPTTLRFVFWPVWMILVYVRFLPDGFSSNLVGIGAMILMSLTNGYFSTLAMMFGPSRVSERNQPAAGTLMPFFLQVGILSGLSLALLLNRVLPLPPGAI